MGYLTLEQFKYIQALERQGKVDEAMKLNAELLDAELQKRAPQLGTLEKAWHAVGNAASSAWDKMMNIGRPDTLGSQIETLKTQIANLLTAILPSCDSANENYFFFTERPLFNVTLVHGQRRLSLPLDRLYAGFSEDPIDKSNLKYFDVEVLLDRSYYAPLGDPSWPDDTLLEFEYMDDTPASAVGSKP